MNKILKTKYYPPVLIWILSQHFRFFHFWMSKVGEGGKGGGANLDNVWSLSDFFLSVAPKANYTFVNILSEEARYMSRYLPELMNNVQEEYKWRAPTNIRWMCFWRPNININDYIWWLQIIWYHQGWCLQIITDYDYWWLQMMITDHYKFSRWVQVNMMENVEIGLIQKILTTFSS